MASGNSTTPVAAKGSGPDAPQSYLRTQMAEGPDPDGQNGPLS